MGFKSAITRRARYSHHVHLDEKGLEQKMKETKNKIRQRRRDNNKIKLEEIRSNLDVQAIKINDANQEKGTYSSTARRT